MLRPPTTSCSTILAACVFALVAGIAGGASAQNRAADRPWSAHVGGGFSLSPGGGVFATSLEYQVLPEVGIGPLLQIAGDDDTLIVAPTANVRYRIDVSESGGEVAERLTPYIQGGLGFAYVEKDRRGGNRDDTEFMLNGGFGLEYRVSDPVSLGSAFLFNGMPESAAGEHFFFTWQLLTARVSF